MKDLSKLVMWQLTKLPQKASCSQKGNSSKNAGQDSNSLAREEWIVVRQVWSSCWKAQFHLQLLGPQNVCCVWHSSASHLHERNHAQLWNNFRLCSHWKAQQALKYSHVSRAKMNIPTLHYLRPPKTIKPRGYLNAQILSTTQTSDGSAGQSTEKNVGLKKIVSWVLWDERILFFHPWTPDYKARVFLHMKCTALLKPYWGNGTFSVIKWRFEET